jgi:nucleoside-diphosphate-sugar epimerase
MLYFTISILILAMVGSSAGMQVLVTGANGFIASHIVKQLLEKGHIVHACVRDATKTEAIHHLLQLPNADNNLRLFSTGDLGAPTGAFDTPMMGCEAVFHAATPLNVKFGSNDGENSILKPAMASTQEILDCIGRNENTVKCLILTSSMSAVAPQSEPAIKNESHWSDPDAQKSRGSWYGATKTLQELLVQTWIEKEMKGTDFKYVAICPTMVVGPNLNPTSDASSGTTGRLLSWFRGDRAEAPNDSMSFIHVDDCARMHTNALELPHAHGRYMCLVESLHWNDIITILQKMYPNMRHVKPYKGNDKVKPTQFNLEKMNTLGVKVRSLEDTFKDSLTYLKARGELD